MTASTKLIQVSKSAHKKELVWSEIAREVSLKSDKRKHKPNGVCSPNKCVLK